MQNIEKPQSRKKFITLGLSAASLFTAFRFFSPKNPKQETAKVKMLTHDGRLVEVDAEKIIGTKRKKVTNEELRMWVNKT